jgi:hypothetical protein
MDIMGKIAILLLFTLLLVYSAQNFNSAKTHLTKLYKSNPDQTTFYYG